MKVTNVSTDQNDIVRIQYLAFNLVDIVGSASPRILDRLKLGKVNNNERVKDQ
jgi:hypothetical protein